ncbi:efflux RND transporter periplasmic adaptor subunit [Thiohalobacter thiocyanaticus]|nr:efflux RND transporter periplasmic adaptor subunit [Thiohalobacter thiocyanaticus]
MSATGFITRVWLLFWLLAGAAHAHSDASGFAEEMSRFGGGSEAQGPRRYAAQVRVDPRHIAGVVLKVNARIVDLNDLYVGRPVREGELLAEYESAELETVQRSYAETYANMEYIREISVTAEEKLIEGRMNLQWRGLYPEDIEKLEQSRDPVKRLRVKSPRSGYLLEVNVTEGQVVNPGAQSGLFNLSGTTLMRIASDQAVTVDVELPLAVAAGLSPGDTAWLYPTPSAPPLEASVAEVVPLVEGSGLRRTVRLEPLASPRLLGLRDGQRLSVSLQPEQMQQEEAGHAH